MSEATDYSNKKEDEYIEAIKKELPNLAQFLTWFSSGKDEAELSRQEFQGVSPKLRLPAAFVYRYHQDQQ